MGIRSKAHNSVAILFCFWTAALLLGLTPRKMSGMYFSHSLFQGKTAPAGRSILELGSSYIVFVIWPLNVNYSYGISDSLTLGAGVSAEMSIFPPMMPVTVTPLISWKICDNLEGWPRISAALELDNIFDNNGMWYHLNASPAVFFRWFVSDPLNPYVGVSANIPLVMTDGRFSGYNFSFTFGNAFRINPSLDLNLSVIWLNFSKVYRPDIFPLSFGLGVFTLGLSCTWLL